MKIVALIPAYNEERQIAATLRAVLAQWRVPDVIVVAVNGSTDNTAAIARSFPVTVMELPRLEHKKSEAMNLAWQMYCQDADLVISLDADTILPPNAVGDWVQEFEHDAERQRVMNRIAPPKMKRIEWPGAEIIEIPQPRRREADRPLGGSSAKFTLRGKSFLTRLQRHEYAQSINQALRRGYASVLAGAGACLSGEALRRVAERPDREGPWCYDSVVEDYELTYRLRELGYHAQVSPHVRAYTDPMLTNKALYSQRMKWTTGMISDVLRFGPNRLTAVEYWNIGLTLFSNLMRILFVFLMVTLALIGQLNFTWVWWVLLPLLFVAVQVRTALRIPHRDRTDLIYAFLIIPAEAFFWLRMRWFFASLGEVLIVGPVRRLLRQTRRDRWLLQERAEAWGNAIWHKVQRAFGRVMVSGVIAALVLIVAGAAIPGLGMPNVGAALGLEVAEKSDKSVTTVTAPPVGYEPPGDCRGYIALTYDDGPHAVTHNLVDALAQYQLHATFYLLGDQVTRDPDTVLYIRDRGFDIGAHSLAHPALVGPQVEAPGTEIYGKGHKLTKAEHTKEIAGSATLIEEVTGEYPPTFRPPYGYTNKKVRKIIEDHDMEQALWTLDTNDWQDKTAEEVARIVNSAEDQDIILMHDDVNADIDAVPLIAEGLAQRGMCTGKIIRGDKEVPAEAAGDGLTEHLIVVKP